MLTAKPSGRPPDQFGAGLIFNKMPNHYELVEWGRRQLAEGLRTRGEFSGHILYLKDVGYGHGFWRQFGNEISPDINKQRYWDMHRMTARMSGADMTLIVSEGWSASFTSLEARSHVPRDLSKYDLSSEVGMIVCESREKRIAESYEIVRDKRGRPRLGLMRKREMNENIEADKSPMMGILYGAPEAEIPVLPGLPN